MKVKGVDPKKLCLKMISRSKCKVQVGAVLTDSTGAYAWGWNSEGPDGYGIHAEIHALSRANPKRVSKSVLWVAAQRKKSGNPVKARPCAACWPAASQCCYVVWRDKDGEWKVLRGSK